MRSSSEEGLQFRSLRRPRIGLGTFALKQENTVKLYYTKAVR